MASRNGATLKVDHLDEVLDVMAVRLRNACHMVGQEAGWYRILSQSDQIGVVATANCLEALLEISGSVPYPDEILRGLIRRQRTDGAWPFISTLHDVGVVDATAAVVIALARWRDHPSSAMRGQAFEGVTRDSLEAATNWLLGTHTNGSWGIIPGAPFRAYSTALAVRSLLAAGKANDPAVRSGVARLIAERDAGTGVWKDFVGRASVPATAECIRAIVDADGRLIRPRPEVSRATKWLIGICEESDYWRSGEFCSQHEEVTVRRGSDIRRIHYHYSSRPMAVVALLDAGVNDAQLWRGASLVVRSALADDWAPYSGALYAEPPSWMVYDVSSALTSIRKRVPASVDAVWTSRTRVVTHSKDVAAVRRRVQEHWPALASLGVCLITLVLLQVSGTMPGIGLAFLGLVVGTILINIISNLIYDHWRRWKE